MAIKKKKKKKKKLSPITKLKMQLEWYNNFGEYILSVDPNLHDEACKHADNIEAGIDTEN